VETWACSSDLFSVLIGSCWGQGTIGEGSVLPFILFFSMHQMMKSCTYQMYHMTTVCCGGSEKQNQNVTAKYNYKNETRSVNGKTAFFFFFTFLTFCSWPKNNPELFYHEFLFIYSRLLFCFNSLMIFTLWCA
jgi:hypothetical protein